MKLKPDKLYPYPVLKNANSGYNQSSVFTAVVNIVDENERVITLSFNAELNDTVLQKLIKEEKARIIYHLECMRTAFRTIIYDKTYTYESTLSKDNIIGTVQIQPLIVAMEDFEYSNENFKDVYCNCSYLIKEGYVLAIGEYSELDITFEQQKKPSIFETIVNTNKEEKDLILLDFSKKEKIYIYMSEKNFLAYMGALNRKDEACFSNLVSAVIVPSLMEVLAELRYNGIQDHEDKQWLKPIKEELCKLGCDKIDDLQKDIDILELAQRLSKCKITGALELLSNGQEGS